MFRGIGKFAVDAGGSEGEARCLSESQAAKAVCADGLALTEEGADAAFEVVVVSDDVDLDCDVEDRGSESEAVENFDRAIVIKLLLLLSLVTRWQRFRLFKAADGSTADGLDQVEISTNKNCEPNGPGRTGGRRRGNQPPSNGLTKLIQIL